MNPKELKGVLESLYDEEWDIVTGHQLIYLSSKSGIIIYLEPAPPRIVIAPTNYTNDEEYKQMTEELAQWEKYEYVFYWNERLITKLGPIISRRNGL